jgi:ribonuclease Z
MGKVMVLGSGTAISEEGHENTHLLIQQNEHTILVDCGSSPLIRLRKAGISYDQVTDLILTHFHPDHVGGVPGFLIESWLMGRRSPLHIYGLAHTIDRTETLMGLFDWKKWPNFYPVIFHRLPEMDDSLVINYSDLRVSSTPVKHLIPTIGLRFSFLPEEKVLAYSCDTEPCPQVVSLAQNADILIHEATGGTIGHSSAAQAAYTARQAGAKVLYLIHYAHKSQTQPDWLDEARHIYPGPIHLAEDLMVIPIEK